MNVASKELCQELYELSGWLSREDADHYWYAEADDAEFTIYSRDEAPFYQVDEYYPAYDLGYVLRKLPKGTNLYLAPDDDHWYCLFTDYVDGDGHTYQQYDADTPENAACKLAIELFKQGVLTKEQS